MPLRFPPATRVCCCPHMPPSATRRRFRSSAIRSRARSTIGFTSPRCARTRARIGSRDVSGKANWRRRSTARLAGEPENGVLRQVALCSREYACFTAQNVFLERGEAALPVSPRCNARCIGCISEQEAGRRAAFASGAHRRRGGGARSGCGCDPPLTTSRRWHRLLRARMRRRTAPALDADRARHRGRFARSSANGTVNLNTNGSMPARLERCIDAGLDAVRISLNSFRPRVYAAYYRPIGYELDDVLESIRLAPSRGLRVSLNLLTHPGVTDDEEEVAAMEAFLRDVSRLDGPDPNAQYRSCDAISTR